MANYQINPLTGIETISGAISRKRLPDGSVQACVVTKKGKMFLRTYKRNTALSDKEVNNRQLFAEVSAEVKKMIQNGDQRRRTEIFKELYAMMKHKSDIGAI